MTIKDGKVFANSRDVAEFFGKQHFNVLQDIDRILEDAPEAKLNFQVCPYQAVAGGRMYRAFDMTRDGFTLLAMGFTGREAGYTENPARNRVTRPSISKGFQRDLTSYRN